MKTVTHYTPTELFELYPEVQKIGWTPTKIGMFFRSGLLVGFISGKSNTSLILESSFIELIKFTNQLNNSRNLNIN